MTMKGRRHSPETRAKMSAAAMGRMITQEQRVKMRTATIGKRHTKEARAKIGAASLGNQYNLGYRHTPEACANMSASKRGNTNVRVSIGSTCSAGGYIQVKGAQPDVWEKRGRIVAGLVKGDGKIAHHKDEDKTNDASSNIQVFESRGAHNIHHHAERRVRRVRATGGVSS